MLVDDDKDQVCEQVTACAVRYIKLGQGGAWEASALDGDRLEWGSEGDPYELASAGDWEGAKAHYRSRGLSPGTATGYVRELSDFFIAGPDTLWITFARDRLWWAFAEPGVVRRETFTASQGRFYRKTIGPWRCTDIYGQELIHHQLSTALTKVASYRQTMCTVGAADYLFRLLNAQADPALDTAIAAKAAYEASVKALVRQLHWADFELLIDLIFARAGWRRISRLGGTLKDHDLLLEQPLSGERLSIQVKSSASQAVFDRYVARFVESRFADRLAFICHSGAPLQLADASIAVDIWSMDRIAAETVAAGLGDWLIARAG